MNLTPEAQKELSDFVAAARPLIEKGREDRAKMASYEAAVPRTVDAWIAAGNLPAEKRAAAITDLLSGPSAALGHLLKAGSAKAPGAVGAGGDPPARPAVDDTDAFFYERLGLPTPEGVGSRN